MDTKEAWMHDVANRITYAAEDCGIPVREALEAVVFKFGEKLVSPTNDVYTPAAHPDQHNYPVEHPARTKPAVIQILEKCIEIYRAKNSDYNHPTKHGIDPLSNFRVAEELGVPAYLGALIRASDKWERIKTLTYKQQVSGEEAAVKDESIEDTLMDMINYAAIILALYKERNDK